MVVSASPAGHLVIRMNDNECQDAEKRGSADHYDRTDVRIEGFDIKFPYIDRIEVPRARLLKGSSTSSTRDSLAGAPVSTSEGVFRTRDAELDTETFDWKLVRLSISSADSRTSTNPAVRSRTSLLAPNDAWPSSGCPPFCDELGRFERHSMSVDRVFGLPSQPVRSMTCVRSFSSMSRRSHGSALAPLGTLSTKCT